MKWWHWIPVLLVGLAIFHFKYGFIVGVSSENLFWGDIVILLIAVAMMLVQGIKKLRENSEIPDVRDQKKE